MKIEDYGYIGDMRTGALVGLDGSIDWLCLPRFDSNAFFAKLLGEENNGCWKIAPEGTIRRATHAYRDETLILETEFETETGRVRLTDFMSVDEDHDLIRIVEGLEGEVEMSMRFLIRSDYGLTIPWVRARPYGLTAVAGPDAWVLRTDLELKAGNRVTEAKFLLRAGEQRVLTLAWHSSHHPVPPAFDGRAKLEATERYWREWCERCTYRGPWRKIVMRSLLTLKGLIYAPTGGIVAAATTSLPEWIGGVRNWDYRFCWLRDATFTLYALMEAGYTEEATAWTEWLLRAVAGDPAQMQIMYGVGGERKLPELGLTHLQGYEGSKPVRVGNAAAEQFQLDVYGEVIDAMHVARTMGMKLGDDAWRLELRLIEFVAKNWMQPDEGIWEIRGPRRHFTHSKLMAWVAIDRAVLAVTDFGMSGDVELWRGLRQEIHDDICARGFNSQVNAFTQFYGSDKLDASLLMLPLVGFLPANDPRVVGTVETIQRELMTDGLVYRYHPDTSGAVDGLPPGEGAFLPCSFWLVDCLYLMERKEEARALFESLLERRSVLGLLAEEYDPERRRLVGNFPQAFTHVGLVNSAQNLSEAAGPADLRSAGGGSAPPFPR